MLEADTILWIFAGGFVVDVVLTVLYGIGLLQRRREDERASLGMGFAVVVSLCVFALAVVLFAFVAGSWMDQRHLYALDLRIYEFFGAYHNAWVIHIMQALTWFGSTQVAIAAITILGFHFWRGRMWERLITMLIVIVPGSAANWMLKAIFDRARPDDALTATVGNSFPSGHSFTATVLYGFLIYMTWIETQSNPIRIGLTFFLMLIILSVAASRIILSAHWTSDVLGGVLFGLAWLISSLLISRIAAQVMTSRGIP